MCTCCSPQAVLQHLTPQEYGSLRLVSVAVSHITTKYIPHITMQLTNTSSRDQIQQWSQATKKFRLVSNIHIHVAGEVSGSILDLTLQLLSEQFHIKQLHLLAVDSLRTGSKCVARLSTLQPLTKLLSAGLHSLVIKSVAVQDLAAQLAAVAQTAPAGGWQLQTLSLDALWSYSGSIHWADFSAALMHVIKAFPYVKIASIRPPHFYLPKKEDIKQAELQQQFWSPFHEDSSSWYRRAGVCRPDHPVQYAEVAVITSIANAVLQWTSLQALTVANAPDIWRADMQTVPSAEESTDFDKVMSHVLGFAPSSLLSVQAAAAAFKTMDDFGCWLFQHQARLQNFQFSTAVTGWSMT